MQTILCSAFKEKKTLDNAFPNTVEEYVKMVKHDICNKPAKYITQEGAVCEFHYFAIITDNYANYLKLLKEKLAKVGLVE